MTSPFSEGRFEHEANHFYYLPKSCFPKLEQPHPTYLIGSRGTGKTTLMKSLHWYERLENVTLRRQLNDQPFSAKFIGNYLKLPTIQLKCFDFWLEDTDEATYGNVFGLYLDLICIELISHSISELLARGELRIPPTYETQAVQTWLSDYQCYECFMGQDAPRSVSQFRSRIRQIRRALERNAIQRVSVEITFDMFPAEQIGSLARSLSKKMAEFCKRDEKSHEQPWYFKVCMDEGESLNPLQQRIINTAIRLSEWPLFYIVSYVRSPDDMITTLIPQLTLQKADREVIRLDNFDAVCFQELAEGVATVRCQEELQDPSVTFNTQQILGSLSINRLIKMILKSSENPKAKQLLEKAEKESKKCSEATEIPIYETYLAEKLELPDSPKKRSEKRRQESIQYRKKMVAAYLSICHEYKVKSVLYASADMVLSISDNCVRDFLSQLDHLFIESGHNLPRFLKGEIKWDVQARAFRKASETKRDSIPDSGVLSPVEIGRIVKALARITATIQSSSEDNRHLRSTERGLFQLSSKEHEAEELSQANELIQDAADAGFLHVKGHANEIKSFCVHASLSPAYGFSYRGAYYPVNIDLTDFNILRAAKTDEALCKASDNISTKISRQLGDSDMPLLKGVKNE